MEFAMVQVPSVLQRIVELPEQINEDGTKQRVVMLWRRL